MTMTKRWTLADTTEALAWLYPWRALEPTSGADVITALSDRLREEQENWDAEIADKVERRAAATERGSAALPLLAFQCAVALAIGSGVLSVLAWAQAALGGVL